MSKYTKLQLMIAEGMECEPGDPKVAAAIEKTAEWFELVLETMGLQPTAIPALVRWQGVQGDLLYPDYEEEEEEEISEEENEVRFKECLRVIDNLKSGEITELMGEAFMEEFRRVSQ
jgi:hypothetical protein